MTASKPSGWYTDPSGHYNLRYWNPNHWTDRVATDDVQSSDASDPDWMPPSGSPSDGTVQPESADKSLFDNVIAQAATLVTVLVAVVYACGASVFFIRLWLLGLPIAAVVGQLPHSLLITVGLPEVFLPALVAGAVLAAWVDRKLLVRGEALTSPMIGALLRFAATSAAVTTPVFIAYHLAEQRFLPGVFWHSVESFVLLTFVGTMVLLCGAVRVSRSLPTSWRHRRATAAILFAFALIPAIAAIPAASPLPAVWACRNEGLTPPFIQGDLLGTSGGYAYIAQFQRGHKSGQNRGRTIVVIPQDQIRITTLTVHTPHRLEC